MRLIQGGFPIRAIILAAGRGTRMSPLTDEVPKGLVHCAGQTLLSRLIKDLEEIKSIEITIGIGWFSSQIREFIDSSFPDSEINLVDVPNYEIGPLETLVTAARDIDEPTIICPVDFVVERGIFSELIHSHTSESESILTIASDLSFGTGTKLALDADGFVVGIGDVPSQGSSTGRSAMALVAEPEFLSACKHGRSVGITSVREVIESTLSRGKSIGSYTVTKSWHDVDTIPDLIEANRDLLSRETPAIKGIFVPRGDTIEAGEQLHLGSDISLELGVTIHGPTIITNDTNIGTNSRIGPFVSISYGTNVQADCFLSDAILFGTNSLSEGTTLSRVVVFNNQVFME